MIHSLLKRFAVKHFRMTFLLPFSYCVNVLLMRNFEIDSIILLRKQYTEEFAYLQLQFAQ